MRRKSLEELSAYLSLELYTVTNPYTDEEIEVTPIDLLRLVALALNDSDHDSPDRQPIDAFLEIGSGLADELSVVRYFMGQSVINALQEELNNGFLTVIENEVGERFVVDIDEREYRPTDVPENLPERIRISRQHHIRVREATRNRRQREKEMGPHLLLASSLEDIESAANQEAIQTIHIIRAGAASLRALETMIDLFPNLRKITVPPSQYVLHFSSSEEKQLLLQHNDIELVQKRHWDLPHYEEVITRREYDFKKRIFDEVFLEDNNPALRSTLERMHELGIINLEILFGYLGGEENSITRLSEEFGAPAGLINKQISSILHLMGYSSTDTRIISHANQMLKELEKAELEILEQERFEEIRGSFSLQLVTDHGTELLPPPEDLPVREWSVWRDLSQIYYLDQERWHQFSVRYPRHAKAIEYMYQLGNFHGHRFTLEMAARNMGLTRERVRQLKNRGLRILLG